MNAAVMQDHKGQQVKTYARAYYLVITASPVRKASRYLEFIRDIPK
jgi:hypothetical protein